jgi:hypothetical protein
MTANSTTAGSGAADHDVGRAAPLEQKRVHEDVEQDGRVGERGRQPVGHQAEQQGRPGAERDTPGQGLPRLDRAVAVDHQRAPRGPLHERVDVAVDVAVDRVRTARGQRAADQRDQDELEGRQTALGEQHGRDRGDQEQFDDARLGQRDQGAEHHARLAAAARRARGAVAEGRACGDGR